MDAHPDAALLRQADRIVADIGVPSCPAILTKLLRESRRDEPDFQLITGWIGSDMGLSAAILKTANSSLYGGSHQLTSIRQALMRVGMRNALQLITGLLLRQALPVSANVYMEDFWEASSRISALSGYLAGAIKVADREAAFAFGLFRDCGMAVMLRKFDDYARVVGRAASGGMRLTDVEVARYGVNHAQVGYATARSWLLPDQLCDAVLHHHSPDAQRGRRGDLDPGSMRLIAVGALAEFAYQHELGETPRAEVDSAAVFSLMQFGISEAALLELAEGAVETAEAA